MMIDRPAWKRSENASAGADLSITRIIRIAHDGVGIGDVKIVADEGCAKRRIQVIEKDAAGLRRSRRRV